MGHRAASKRQVLLPDPTDELDNTISEFPRPPSSPSGHHPSLSVVSTAAQLSDFDRRRHSPLLGSLFPLRPRHHTAPAVVNPQFPLIPATNDDRIGGRALLDEFITFLELKSQFLLGWSYVSLHMPITVNRNITAHNCCNVQGDPKNCTFPFAWC